MFYKYVCIFLKIFSYVFKIYTFIEDEVGSLVGEVNEMCMSPSHLFKGLCLRSSNCAAICKTEGFTDGKCKGFFRRCFCIKPC